MSGVFIGAKVKFSLDFQGQTPWSWLRRYSIGDRFKS